MALAPRVAAWQRQFFNLPGPNSAPNAAGQAPEPVDIEYCWIQTPLTRRPTTAITKAQITQAGGLTALSSADDATVRQYGANTAVATLQTAVDADAQNLGDFLTTYQSTPRPRQPTMTFDLVHLDDDAALTILSVQLGQRCQLIYAPAATPAGAVSFVVEGIAHQFGVATRLVIWQTSAPIGTVAGTPGPWFRWGSSSWSGSDLRPF